MTNVLSALLSAPLDAPAEWNGYAGERIAHPGGLEEAVALRSHVFADEGFIDPADYAGGLFRDDLDAHAAHLGVRSSEGELVGVTRFVLPGAPAYSTERLFEFRRPAVDRARLGEFGRLEIARAHRGGARTPMLLLLTLVYRCMREADIEWVYAFMPPRLVASYAALGCVSHPLEVLPPTPETLARRRSMHGYFEKQDVGPVLFRLGEMLKEIHK